MLVTPDQHRENLYELPPQSGHAVHDLVREVAIAVRQVYECGGAAVRRMARSGA